MDKSSNVNNAAHDSTWRIIEQQQNFQTYSREIYVMDHYRHAVSQFDQAILSIATLRSRALQLRAQLTGMLDELDTHLAIISGALALVEEVRTFLPPSLFRKFEFLAKRGTTDAISYLQLGPLTTSSDDSEESSSSEGDPDSDYEPESEEVDREEMIEAFDSSFLGLEVQDIE